MKKSLLTKVLPFVLMTSLACCGTISESKQPASREDLLLRLGIPKKFHNYREELLKLPCFSTAVDKIMWGLSFHAHHYLIPGEDDLSDVIEYYPFSEDGTKPEHPLVYFFGTDFGGFYLIDPGMNSLNGDETFLNGRSGPIV